jgi:hypothetical protein
MVEDDAPTLKDIWRLLGTMNRRFDGLERQGVEVREQLADFRSQLAELKAQMVTGFGALKESIEARDFRLDEHGRRITDLEMLVRG